MTEPISQAASALHQKLADHPWYVRTVVGKIDNDPAFFVFVASEQDKGRDIPYLWQDHHVLVRVASRQKTEGSPR